MKNNHKWTTCRDSIGERFDGDIFDTKEEAIADLKKEIEAGLYEGVKKQGYFWVGQILSYSSHQFMNAEDILQNAADYALDEAGEFAEDWLSFISKEQKEELDKLLAEWVEKNVGEPNFFQIINSEKVIVEEK